jgi:hypothetical protein
MKRLISVLMIILMISVLLTSCGFSVLSPERKTGEFNFSVTYEYNGETKTVSGVYMCEYNGINWAIDAGHYRDWSDSVKGEKIDEKIEIGTIGEEGKIELVLDFYPEYFMDDPAAKDRSKPKPYITVTLSNESGITFLTGADEVFEVSGARIISYEYDEPIENSFGLFK